MERKLHCVRVNYGLKQGKWREKEGKKHIKIKQKGCQNKASFLISGFPTHFQFPYSFLGCIISGYLMIASHFSLGVSLERGDGSEQNAVPQTE